MTKFSENTTEEVVQRFNELLEEIDNTDDDTPAKALADLYRELADAIEEIGLREEEASNG